MLSVATDIGNFCLFIPHCVTLRALRQWHI